MPKLKTNRQRLFKKVKLAIAAVVLLWPILHLLPLAGLYLSLAAIPIGAFIFRKKYSPLDTILRSVATLLLVVTLSLACVPVISFEYNCLRSKRLPSDSGNITFSLTGLNSLASGETTAFTIQTSPSSEPVNVYRVNLRFDADYLEILEFQSSNAQPLLLDKLIDNHRGLASFILGGRPPLDTPNTGVLGTLVARAHRSGETRLTILESSLALAADGRGTNQSALQSFSLPLTIAATAYLPEDQASSVNQAGICCSDIRYGHSRFVQTLVTKILTLDELILKRYHAFHFTGRL